MSVRDWTMVVLQLRGALLAREGMRDPEASQAVRDQSTDRYCRAVDQIVDRLEALQDARLLGEIGEFLRSRGQS